MLFKILTVNILFCLISTLHVYFKNRKKMGQEESNELASSWALKVSLLSAFAWLSFASYVVVLDGA